MTNFTWGIVGGQAIHLGCSTPEEALMAWEAFLPSDASGSNKECPRCGIPLSESPDP